MAAKRGPPGNLQNTTPINVTVPDALLQYMIWLATHSMYGPTVQDVVLKLITPQLQAMFDGGYHNKRLPEVGIEQAPPAAESS